MPSADQAPPPASFDIAFVATVSPVRVIDRMPHPRVVWHREHAFQGQSDDLTAHPQAWLGGKRARRWTRKGEWDVKFK